jgi:predicted dehydrogenase
MSKAINRRQAMKYSAALAGGYYIGTAARPVRAASANEKLNVACIGVGAQGSGHCQAMRGQNLIAIADVDEKRAGKNWEAVPSDMRFHDYRKLFDAVGGKLDAVVISTPDHTHFHPAYIAMQLGLHTYVEKPLGHNVWETRTLTDLARKKKLATQLGTQRHNLPNMRRSVELIKSGVIGPVTKVYCWMSGSRGMPSIPTDTPKVPPHLDYDLWVGPAEFRPYHPSFCPYGWRFWWDYGTGETGNWGCHILDIPFWALDLAQPTRVDATGPQVDAERTPTSMRVTFEFPARGPLPAVTLYWEHGKPEILSELKLPDRGFNTLFVGQDGMLLTGFDKRQWFPKDKFAGFKEPASTLPEPKDFRGQWIDACRGGAPASCNFDYSGPLSETVLLGNVAYRAGGFDWDGEKLQTKGNAKAQELIREAYRKGWEV